MILHINCQKFSKIPENLGMHHVRTFIGCNNYIIELS